MTGTELPSVSRSVISFDFLLIAGIVIQLISFPLLWQHSSESGEAMIGGFSLRYVLILGINVAFTVFLLIVFAQRRRAEFWLQKTPLSIRYAIFMLVLVALI